MKDAIIAILMIVFVVALGIFAGYRHGINSQDPLETRVERVMDIIEIAKTEWDNIYQNGFDAGEKEGFDKGYLTCYNGLGMNWLGSYQRFVELSRKYGSLHNTPWDEFVLEEKAVICMYGGSGSKMRKDEIEDFREKYGVK